MRQAMRCCAFFTMAGIWSMAGTEDKLVGGPYVVNVTGRSATVMWLLETARPTLGTEPGKADKSAPALRTEKVSFSGLAAGKTYYYDIGAGPDGRGSFRTPSASGPCQFVVYGDTRTRHDVHRTVIAGILKAATPDFIVHTGDQVADG
jgi:phosphodiesterase/alkaline phosphatase D-like protein